MDDRDTTKEELINELSELQRQVVLLRTLVGADKVQMCCQTLDKKGRIIDINTAWTELAGYSKNEVSGCLFVDLIIPEYRKQFNSRFLEPVVNGESSGIELEIYHKNGSRLGILLSGARIRDDKGNLAGIHCILYDVTVRRRVEEALRSERQRLYTVLNELPAIIYLQAPDYTIPFANRLFRDNYGDPEGRHCYKLIHGRSSPCEKCRTFKVFETGSPQVWETQRPSGRVLQIYDYPFSDIDGSPLVLDLGIDITDLKKAEESLRVAEEKYRTVVDNANEAIFVAQDGTFKFGNARAFNFAGYTKEELISKPFLALIHPDERQTLAERHLRRLQGEDFSTVHQYRIIDSKGNIRWIDMCSVLISWEGKPATLNFVSDITERKLAEEALRESEEKYRTILDSIEDGYFEVDIEGNLTFFNNSLCKISGYSEEELIGVSYRSFIPDYSLSRVFKTFNMVFRTGKPEKLIDWEYIKKDCSIGYFEASISLMKNKEGKPSGFRSVVRDVTEKRRAEDRLRFLSLHDPLTGLYNRAYFEQEMRRLSTGRQYPVGVILCDVDGLKLVNDTLGHEAGDNLLKGAAGVIKSSFRNSDVVSRIGGDEFAVLLPHSNRADIENAVKRIRNAVSERNIKNPELPLSLSVGFAVSGEKASDLGILFKEADNNMYREKLHSSQSARSAIVQTLMKALEARDFITEGHADRLQGLVVDLAREIALSEYSVNDLKLFAQFHDIGKVGISDLILFKPGPLTPEEKSEMQRHSEIGHRIAQSLPDMTPIADWILKHHEWWNGGGYPLGLKSDQIPLECRILAIADAYDAMTSDRPYRKAMSRAEALKELEKHAGVQFDPQLVMLFVQMIKRSD
ncbi:MAG: PAS domain S-box protein [Bacillota bacterium]